MSVCLYPCLSYSVSKSHLFCDVPYSNLLHVWLHHVFPHYLIMGKIFSKKKNLLNMNCVFTCSTTFVYNFFILSSIQGDSIINLHNLHVKYLSFLSDLNYTFLFLLDRFSKSNCASNLMKIRPVVAELFDADRQTDGRPYMMQQIVAFRNFSKAPKYT